MSTLKADTIQNTSGGAATLTKQQAAKAWVNFNGTGTIATRDSFNLSSLTDNGTGLYLLSYSSSMANDDYAVSGIARSPGATSGIFNAPSDAASDIASGSTEVYSLNTSGTPTDLNHIFANVHGDLA